MILQFGQYRGYDIQDLRIPDSYILWLADRGRSTYYKGKHTLDVAWKPDIKTWEVARKEAERRGYEKHGERWEMK